MAAMVEKATEKDWREDCVKPEKDTRVQTLVRMKVRHLLFNHIFLKYPFIHLGCDCN